MEKIFFEGFFLQASLIFALGAQNIFVLDSGVNKRHPLVVCLVCFICDALLITLGVWGVGSFFSSSFSSKILLGVIGVIFLFHYGISKILQKTDEFTHANSQKNEDIKRSIKTCVLMSVTFSLLNPHAYLDAFLLIGGYATQFSSLDQRLMLGAGASIFSLVWFIFLSLASHIAGPLLREPRIYRYVNQFAGVLLIFLSVKLSRDIWSWINDDIITASTTNLIK